jgi:hypothetical protein
MRRLLFIVHFMHFTNSSIALATSLSPHVSRPRLRVTLQPRSLKNSPYLPVKTRKIPGGRMNKMLRGRDSGRPVAAMLRRVSCQNLAVGPASCRAKFNEAMQRDSTVQTPAAILPLQG